MSEHEKTENPARADITITTAERDELARHERAFTLYCQGWRVTHIAATFGIDTQTIRAWIAASLRALENEQTHDRASLLARALASQRMLTAAAWASYEREREIERQLLADEDERQPSRHTSHAPRYLSIALAAEREIARLQGLHTPAVPAPAEVRIVLERLPDFPANATTATDPTAITDDQPPALPSQPPH
jgi:hypothetical protein